MTIEATLERIAVALERIADGLSFRQQLIGKASGESTPEAKMGAFVDRIRQVGAAAAVAAVATKPPTQTVAAVGADMAGFAAPAATWPQYAVEARKLCDNPAFQEWAAAMTKTAHSAIPDSVAHALNFLCVQCRATKPADFTDSKVIAAFLALRQDFEATHAA